MKDYPECNSLPINEKAALYEKYGISKLNLDVKPV
jgi:ATP-dependent RNA circularization protein (DNA/RNA ligase family)